MRTIRLSKELDDLLQKDANAKRISVGALLSNILTKYSEWDRYAEKFAMITLRQETIKAILEATNEDTLIEKAREIGAKIPREFLMFWLKRTDLEAYIRYMELLCNYGSFARFELNTDGRTYVITLLHDMGQNWSIFLRYVMEDEKTMGKIMNYYNVGSHDLFAKYVKSLGIDHDD